MLGLELGGLAVEVDDTAISGVVSDVCVTLPASVAATLVMLVERVVAELVEKCVSTLWVVGFTSGCVVGLATVVTGNGVVEAAIADTSVVGTTAEKIIVIKQCSILY